MLSLYTETNVHQKRTRLSLAFNISSAALAFIIWGSWAYYANSGSDTRLISALTQALASFCITLILVHMVTFIFHLLPKTPLRIILPAIISVSLTGSALILAHTLAGTSKILLTIAPALTVAFTFCVVTALKLNKTATHAKEHHV